MKQTVAPLTPLVTKLSTNPLVSSSVYRVLVVAADLADNGHKISSFIIAEKLGCGSSGAYLNLKKLVSLGFLSKVPKTRDNYVFCSQEQWLKPVATPLGKIKNDIFIDGPLHDEIKALQELTKELISKLNK